MADWRGVATSKAKPLVFDAFMRTGAKPMTSSRPSQQLKQTPSATPPTSLCRAGSRLSLAQQPEAIATPPFFLYPPAFAADALAECYAHHKGHAWNASLDAGLWTYQALQQHPSRVSSAAQAEVFFVASFAQLSEAAGSCERSIGSHYSRMAAAARSLRVQPAFEQRPTSHLVINGVASTMRNPLGELGELIASRGGRAACLDAKLCGAFKADRMVPLPHASSAVLQRAMVRAIVDDEACGVKRPSFPFGEKRVASLFFRGGLGISKEGQEVRARIPLLRQLSGSMIGITGGEKMLPATYEYLMSHGHRSINRIKRLEGDAYVKALMRARYCLVPPADHLSTPGQRLIDAVAAGCVPILVGIEPGALPLGRVLRYSQFSASISRRSFLKDPVYHVESLLHRIEPTYTQMLRALADARPRLLYGIGEHGPLIAPPSAADANATVQAAPPRFGDTAGLLLREFKMAVVATPVALPQLV